MAPLCGAVARLDLVPLGRLCPWPLVWAGVVRGCVPLLLCFVRLDADTVLMLEDCYDYGCHASVFACQRRLCVRVSGCACANRT